MVVHIGCPFSLSHPMETEPSRASGIETWDLKYGKTYPPTTLSLLTNTELARKPVLKTVPELPGLGPLSLEFMFTMKDKSCPGLGEPLSSSLRISRLRGTGPFKNIATFRALTHRVNSIKFRVFFPEHE